MAVNFLNGTLFRANSGGTGAFVPASAITGYRNFSTALGAVVSDTYRYRAESDDLSQWEIGYGVWNGTNLTRVVTQNSAGNTSAINFTIAPRVGITELDLDWKRTAKKDESNTFAAGTINIFNDTTDASNSTSGAIQAKGGIGALKNIWTNQHLVTNRNVLVRGLLHQYWGVDFREVEQTIVTGSNLILAAGSGLVVANNVINGGVSLWLLGGGNAALIGQAGSDFSATPTSGFSYFWFFSGNYLFTNNTGGTLTYAFAALRTRDAV